MGLGLSRRALAGPAAGDLAWRRSAAETVGRDLRDGKTGTFSRLLLLRLGTFDKLLGVLLHMFLDSSINQVTGIS